MDGIYGTNLNGRAIYIKNKSDSAGNHIQSDAAGLKTDYTWQGTIKRNVAQNIKSKVNFSLKRYDENINDRRNRLKKLLEQEEIMLNKDFNQLTKYSAPKISSKETNEIDDSQNTNPDEEELLAQKLLQIDLAKCKEVRPMIAKRRAKETQSIQKQQMIEKNNVRLYEKKVDNMWHNIMINDVKSRKKYEEDIAAKQLQKEMAAKEFLDSQIKISEEMKKNALLKEKEIDLQRALECKEKFDWELSEEAAKRKQSKLEIKQHLIKQMNIEHDRQQKLKEDIYQLETSMCTSSISELKEKERKELEYKESVKKDINLFNEHLAAIKSNRAVQEKNDEEMIAKVSYNQLLETEKQISLFEKKRKQLLMDAISERDLQMKEKEAQKQFAAQQAAIEFKNRVDIENNITQIEKMEKNAITNTKSAYKEYLENQMIAYKIAQKNEMEKMKLEHENITKKNEEFNRRCTDFMKREFATEMAHPFNKAMKKDIQLDSSRHAFIPETKYLKY